MKQEIKTFDEINKIADKIAYLLKNGIYKSIGLIGDLGTGKTYFTKRLCKNLHILENIKSPTFNYVHTYKTKDIVLSHFDVYRIINEDEMFEIGYEDYLDDRILIIEWANKILDILPNNTLCIEFEYYDDYERKLSIYTFEKGEKKYVNFFNNNKY